MLRVVVVLLDPSRQEGALERLDFLVGEELHLAPAVAQRRADGIVLGESRGGAGHEGDEVEVVQPVCRFARRGDARECLAHKNSTAEGGTASACLTLVSEDTF